MLKQFLVVSILVFLITSCSVSHEKSKIVSSNIVLDNEQISIKEITYLSDGLNVKGYLAEPKEEKQYPCVIYCRGGNRDFGMITEAKAEKLLGHIANWGYVVIASQYRGVMGGEGFEEFGGDDVNDVINLIDILATIPNADTSRIGIYGFSRGGMMTYISLTRTEKIDAAIIRSGASDLLDGARRRPEMDRVFSELIPDYENNRESELKSRSAIYWAEKLRKTPILLLHGSLDMRVHPTQALRMADTLFSIGHPFRFVFYEGGSHSLREHIKEVNSVVKIWLDNYVRDGKKLNVELLEK
ncbi:MAG: prolyl oligopeptidase family serine peptidase [Calditrichaeota bacterium]|nr:prolyl oligopeptidase family serine peptidase [Calditrichota bacterium]MBT7619042.1 prolyl oligopeptidase family serine peptidase [Calditrichota bacterium]MBT7790815.1 prolyl oligopeptidase family serine peptidase [Calditrichota bacterium]